jgi:hypothetical protein
MDFEIQSGVKPPHSKSEGFVNPVTNVVQLRQMLAERFPHLRFGSGGRASSRAVWPTGVEQIDNILNGGLPRSAITELTCPKPSSGSALLAFALLQRAHESRQWVALVDGMDTFDPARIGEEPFPRFLWVRCRNALQALQASDLLLRDGNLALVILDLRMNPANELRKVSSATWHRFQRLIESNSTVLFVTTPRPLVANARARLELIGRFRLDALDKPEQELLSELKVRLVHQRSIGETDEIIAQAG